MEIHPPQVSAVTILRCGFLDVHSIVMESRKSSLIWASNTSLALIACWLMLQSGRLGSELAKQANIKCTFDEDVLVYDDVGSFAKLMRYKAVAMCLRYPTLLRHGSFH